MEQELRADEGSYITAARVLEDSAELFGGHTDALLTAISGGGRSPWGAGLIGMAMDEVNELLAQACRHVHHNLGTTGEALQAMADRYSGARHATTAAVQAVHQDLEDG
ncbi:hypothetical protein ACOZ38_20240 [Sphaerisporangium viridialbum]|uniref:hypothetical protein n=1 Tax=Sphaerisporangium viridialbum TaxID=46189 RepID=UPI003C7946FC